MTGGGGGGGAPQATEVDNTTTTDQSFNNTTIRNPDPYLRAIQQAYLSNIPTMPDGALVAPLAPQSLMANNLAQSFATDPSTYSSYSLADASAQLATSPLMSGTTQNQLQTLNTLSDVNNLDPRSNPFTAAAADAANRQTVGTLVNDVLPQIRGGAITAGQFGGSRQGVAEGNAVSGAAQAISDTTSKMFFGQYNQNVANALNSIRQTPATLMLPQQAISGAINDRNAANQQAMQALDALDKTGQQLQSQAQSEISAEINKWMVNNTMPLDVIRAVGGLTTGFTTTQSGTSSGTTHQTGTTLGPPTPSVSPLQGGIAGGLAGASMGSALGVSSAAMPWFAIGGAALGLLTS